MSGVSPLHIRRNSRFAAQAPRRYTPRKMSRWEAVMSSLQGKTLFITGASRGIGLAIALRAARDGANIAIAAKTTEPHPRLKGTIYTAADEIRAAGGQALPLVCDIRDEAQVMAAIAQTVDTFGGIDVCVNNASAISLTTSQATDMKRFDLMMGINTRGTFMVSKYCIPHLKKAANPHILMLSPPLDMKPRWFGPSTAYTMAKYGMSMCVLGLSAELKRAGIAVNALWPRTTIATAAVGNLLGGDAMMRASRTPEIMADAAHAILTRASADFTGQFCIDDKVLYAAGVRDFERYRVDPSVPLMSDFFVPDDDLPPPGVTVQPLPSVGEVPKAG
jgi:citronellol/citronellal dehydrogenase